MRLKRILPLGFIVNEGRDHYESSERQRPSHSKSFCFPPYLESKPERKKKGTDSLQLRYLRYIEYPETTLILKKKKKKKKKTLPWNTIQERQFIGNERDLKRNTTKKRSKKKVNGTTSQWPTVFLVPNRWETSNKQDETRRSGGTHKLTQTDTDVNKGKRTSTSLGQMIWTSVEINIFYFRNKHRWTSPTIIKVKI